ncbi:uncharacterized protein [Watersipora subatra]|uniref:uncharacterized protein n=1 Tax=Watersipora subatra TaxID=2589382 RepID=UPI00355C699C
MPSMWSICSMFLLACTVTADQTTVIAPPDTSGPAIGFVILPGAQISADQYLSLGKKIQADSPYSVWLATVGGWLANMINPLQLSSFVDDAVKKMHVIGLPVNAPVFMAAHSLGGVFLDDYIRSNPQSAAGVVLYGSYISKSVKLKDYPLPVLTASGDQDGLCRMTRIIKDYGPTEALTDSMGEECLRCIPHVGLARGSGLPDTGGHLTLRQLKTYTPRTPVVIVPGVNHSLIASGEMPSLVQTNDLEADCTEMEAHALLSNITNSFLILNGPKTNESLMKSANGTLELYYKQNMDVANYYLSTEALDGAGNSSTADLAAVILSDLISNDYQLRVNGTITSAASFLTTDVQASIYGKTLKMLVPMYNLMPLNPLDISLTQQSPNELYVKTLSKRAIHAGLPNASFADHPRRCNDSNYATVVISELPSSYWRRYTNKGRQLEFEADNVLQNEITWLATGISWTYSTENKAKVVSPYYEDENFLMCKLLSFSRVAEWMLIDAFKKIKP